MNARMAIPGLYGESADRAMFTRYCQAFESLNA
jgi:hypothetical protein